MPAEAYTLWTERGLSCRLSRHLDGWDVCIEAREGMPFLRRFAHSRGDAGNQAEYLRLLLDRSRAGARRPRERQPLILIVEDDAENLLAYEETLRLDGFRTASALTIAEARGLMREIRPAAVLLDHLLPDGEGLEWARELRNSGVHPTVPIVLVTGMDPERVSAACGGGPDALLGKPCRPETLTGVLKLITQRVPQRRTVTPHVAGAAPPLGRARCPLCGTPGALVDEVGSFHCQQCGREGRFERDLYVDTHV